MERVNPKLNQQLLALYRAGLQDIGYLDAHIKPDYDYADVYDAEDSVRRIEMAAFAQEPPSIRNACLGFAKVQNSDINNVSRYRALGAPHLFALHLQQGIVRWWQMRSEGPRFVEEFRAEHLPSAMRQNRALWSPEAVLRAKSIGSRSDTDQLDFFDGGLIPALEEVVHRKLDALLRSVLDFSKAIYTEFHDSEPDYQALFRLIFRLLAAKLLIDRRHPGAESWTGSDARTVIKAVEELYFSGAGNSFVSSNAILQDERVQNAAWKRIRDSFHFPNLPLEALAYVYENTLVDESTRKQHDTHATPPAFAEYIVSRLPFHHLAPEDRRVFEPFCGHAPFLIAALGRLRDLLPSDMGGDERHHYLTRMLSGIEIDSFAREVALYSLMLADYPHANGWNIVNADAFSSPVFNELLESSQIVLCNPPYGPFTPDQREIYTSNLSVNKAAEALGRVLRRQPQMLGFVLPRAFLDARRFGPMRREIAQQYNDVTLISLPDIAFKHSQVETALIVAHGKRSGNPISRSAFVGKKDYEVFLRTGKPTWVEVGPTRVLQNNKDATLWRTPLQNVWDALSHLKQIKDVATIHRGIEYSKGSPEDHVSSIAKPGYFPGLQQVADGFEPYVVRSHVFLEVDDDIMRGNAHNYPWSKPKVITNAARLSRGPWTIAAAIDTTGLRCYQRLQGVWPKGEMSLEVLAAILNGQIANAFITTQRASPWDNQKQLINLIPVPDFTAQEEQLIIGLVRIYITARQQLAQNSSQAGIDQCTALWRRIDNIVLDGYRLSPEEAQQLRRHFLGEPRPERLINAGKPIPATFDFVETPTTVIDETTTARAAMAVQRKKNQAAISLLESWLDDDDESDGQSWEETKRSLNENRLSARPLFPKGA